jgi:FtsP/CotA-like multicopper oxidase with cupredoxin domain
VLEVGGSAPVLREWKDTINVPAHQTLRFAVAYDDRPGMWMFHCHILDHAELGMMGSLMLMR